MNEAEIQRAVQLLKIMSLDLSIEPEMRNALELATEIMTPIYGMTTVTWEKATCQFVVPGEIASNLHCDEIIRKEAISQMTPMLAAEVAYALRSDFLTCTTEACAWLLVGKRGKL